MSEITIREFAVDEFPLILPLIEKLNPNQQPEELRRRLEVMTPHGYHCIGAFDGETLVGAAGFWLGARFYCGEYMDVDNVIVEPTLRSQGIGAQMMAWLHETAEELGRKVVVLDSYMSYTDAHRFYERLGYEKLGYHFSKKMDA
jgi:GNAT superfamily N-acetyltransferase